MNKNYIWYGQLTHFEICGCGCQNNSVSFDLLAFGAQSNIMECCKIRMKTVDPFNELFGMFWPL